jgi:uncharacterized membrane protein YkvA (DUF1232 family)
MSENKPVPIDRGTAQLGMLTGMFHQLKLVWALFTDKRVSLLNKMVIPLTLLYLVSPIDFLPAAIFPGVGALDDLGVILLGMALFVKLCPPELVDYYRRQLEYGSDSNNEEAVDTTYRVIDEEE